MSKETTPEESEDSSESRLDAPDEAIQDPEAASIAAELDQAVVVGCESVEPLSRGGSAGKSEQKPDQHLLIVLGGHDLLANLLLSHKSALGEVAEDRGQLLAPGLSDYPKTPGRGRSYVALN